MVGEHIQYYFSSFKFVEVCFMVFLSSFVSLLIFFLVLSVVEGEELPTRIVDLNFFFLLVLLVFAFPILQLCCLVYIHLGLLVFLVG